MAMGRNRMSLPPPPVDALTSNSTKTRARQRRLREAETWVGVERCRIGAAPVPLDESRRADHGGVVSAQLRRRDDEMRERPEAFLRGLAQPPVPGHAAAEHDRRRRVLGLRCLDPLEQRVDDRFLVAGREVGALLLAKLAPLTGFVE